MEPEQPLVTIMHDPLIGVGSEEDGVLQVRDKKMEVAPEYQEQYRQFCKQVGQLHTDILQVKEDDRFLQMLKDKLAMYEARLRTLEYLSRCEIKQEND